MIAAPILNYSIAAAHSHSPSGPPILVLGKTLYDFVMAITRYSASGGATAAAYDASSVATATVWVEKEPSRSKLLQSLATQSCTECWKIGACAASSFAMVEAGELV